MLHTVSTSETFSRSNAVSALPLLAGVKTVTGGGSIQHQVNHDLFMVILLQCIPETRVCYCPC
jgi:hypothetical protein